ncbi:MAG TPA: Glu/Leu/Phe/Val dehydrogenase dimerization domain-containing protein [Candidatus Deferrimicrobium sp.]|nr:Glu/Leu/Phe/Val dehydrogenase dimerization domain-containing protein [Candidatus Deferrimicrobium sp.]
MGIFESMKENNHEQIAFYTDQSVKLRAILAIHSTALGPAMGGTRIYKYESVNEALFDLFRLSSAMTYKTAAGGINFGGGYMVVFEQEGMEKKEPMFRSLGRFVESLKGRFIAGGEFGVTEETMEYIKMETDYITGLPSYYGGSGNHSYMCAYGVFMGLLAAAKYRWGSDGLTGKKIIIHGYGKIGSQLADFAVKKGAQVVVADIDLEKVKKALADGHETIPVDRIYTEKCDILAPCSVGAVINPETAGKFNCEIIAGSANNQLLNEEDEFLLKKRNILYVPDFIINVGGMIDVSEEYLGYKTGYKKDKVTRKTENIYERVLEILRYGETNNMTAHRSAICYAEQRIESLKRIKGTFCGKGKM